ncbi:hypothetical protein ACJMK2_012578 [Sinanodonta woodiana]
MSIPTRFSDGQYKNWLKCSLSLIMMKETLHEYTHNAVKQLHGNMTQNISSISFASSTSNQCGSCSSKNIRLTENPRKWSISCNNNICDKWLQRILAFHEEPHNRNINWKNADISQWPVDCYQVAKIFMPKGQDKTVKMPDDLDAPAILSLFKYCNWFRKDLPNTQIMSDLIDIRNKLLHSGEMRVVDGDKDSWIDLMMQLLSDLNIHVDTQAELEKLKKEDIDINFRENEIRVFKKMASDLASDITTLKEDMASMQKSLSEVSEKVSDSKMESAGKVDALEADMEIIRKYLHELRVIYDKMVSFFDKNPGILEKDIAEKFQSIDLDVKDLQSNLTRVETELQSRVSSLEKHRDETNIEIKGLEKQMKGIDVRLVAIEEQKKHETETTENKSPETEGLRQLKNQTENILRTHRKLKYILTEQGKKAEKLLAEKRSIVIEGNPGEGKTTLSRHLIDNERFKDKRVVLNKPSQWEKVDTDSVAIVVLEDVFGKYDFDPGRLQEWMVHLPTIQEHVDVGELQVIVTTRVDVLSKAYCQRLGSLKLFSKELSHTLSSKQLTNSEKMSILKRELDKNQRNMKEDKIKLCISNFGGLIGFPQCCSLFAGDIRSFEKGPDFFRSPKKFFVQNIEGLEPAILLSLAFLFCNGKILEENLSSETMPQSSKKILMELASSLCFSENQAAITLLRDAYDNFGEMYVVKSMSYDFSLEPVIEKPSIMFTHATVSEAVGHVLGKHCCEMVVKYSDSEYLYQRTSAAEVEDSTSENVFIPVSVYGLLAERMVLDVVNKRLVSSVVKHSALTRYDFIKKLKFKLNNGNLLKDFFMAGKDEFQSDTLSEGKCITFMQYILQDDEDVVRLVYSELLEMLTCAHNDNTPDCWRCEEKQNLLELALYYHHFEIADKLIAMKACYTHVSLCNAARHGDLKIIEQITESLKTNHFFKPLSEEAIYALYRAYVSGNQSLIEFLLKEGIVLHSMYVVNAVKHEDMNVLKNMVEHLKRYNNWNPRSAYASEALEVAICRKKYDVYQLLVQDGVSLKMENLLNVIWVSEISLEYVKKEIQHMKDTGNWDPKCDEASEALEAAIHKKKYDVYDLLVQDGVSLKMENLPGVVMGYKTSLESVKKVIQHLKDTDKWDPKCDDASDVLEAAICIKKYDVYDLLVQDGVSLKMKNLLNIIWVSEISMESLQEVIQHLKESDNWDPKCDYACKALEIAIYRKKYDVYDLLVQDGVSLKMKNLLNVIWVSEISLESLQKMIQHLKESDNWDPKCDYACKALEFAIYRKKYDVYDLLVRDGVSLKMNNLQNIIMEFEDISLESVKKVIQHLKDTDNWDPKCDDASEALKVTILEHKDDVYDLLVQDGVSLKMNNLQSIIMGVEDISLEALIKVIQDLKENDNWDPNSEDASKVLEVAIHRRNYDVYDLLVQDGVSLKMENFLSITMGVDEISLESVMTVIHYLKEIDNWNPKCDAASEVLSFACNQDRYDVVNLLVQEGVVLNEDSSR